MNKKNSLIVPVKIHELDRDLFSALLSC